MPFTVSCAACNSRFLLGDDLFRRKVSGKVVTVKCRACNAEISVDATELPTLPSHEAPKRAHPAPPRPKHKAGDPATGTPLPLDTAPATGTPLPLGTASATGTPLPLRTASATGTPLPRPKHLATGTPLPHPKNTATSTPLPAGALLSIWDAAERSTDAPRHLPPPRGAKATVPAATDGEFITEIEEAPRSSSDAPTLSALKQEAAPPKGALRTKKPPDDFLVNLSAGTGGILGAPTIDVTGLGSPPPPEVEELRDVETAEKTPRAGTAPQFDMSAVLPVQNKAAASSLSPSNDLSVDVEMPDAPTPSARLRERKHVVPPKPEQDAPAAKPRRAGAAVWFVLVAAAAGVLLVVGLRSHGASPPAQAEPQATAEHPAPPAESPAPANDAPAAVAATVATVPSPAANDPAPKTNKTTPSATTPSSAAVANGNGSNAKSAEATKPTAAAPAVEKPLEAEKPAPAPKPEPAEPGAEFDRAAAVAALKAAAAQAAACRKDGDPTGTAALTITFAPSGRVTSANIQGPPFAGTPTGGCIANAMRHAQVPAFSGDRVTVNKTIVIQ
jgi:hypothetical protein